MRVVRRATWIALILLTLAGCANKVYTNTSPSGTASASAVGTVPQGAVPTFPSCAVARSSFDQLRPGPSGQTNGFSRIPKAAPGPMSLCRYRPVKGSGKLAVLSADITVPLAPVALLHTLGQLKTVDEVYGPNAAFSCPMSRDAVDVVILRTATGSKWIVIKVARDGCPFVNVNRVAYVSSASLLTELDAIKAIS